MATPTTSGPVSIVPLSGNSYIDSLVGGTKWGGPTGWAATVTFSFPYSSGSAASWYTDPVSGYGPGSEPYRAFALSPTQHTASRIAFQQWAHVANVTFAETVDNQSTVGDIRVTFTNNFEDSASAAAYARRPSTNPMGGDIWLDANDYWTTFNAVNSGSYGFFTLLHEIGHALGLKHPFDGTIVLPPSYDQLAFTVMSYTAAAGYPDSSLSFYPTTPMWYDIMAMQYVYGPNMSYHSGNDTYVYYAYQDYFETIWDAGGTDTIQYVSSFQGGTIDLAPGHWSQLGLELQIYTSSGTRVRSDTVIIYGTVTIENAIGGEGPDTIIGNDVANLLRGGRGNDTVSGGSGNDTLIGGAGNDSSDGGSGIDIAVFNSNRAAYSIAKTASGHTVSGAEGNDTLSNIERLKFSDKSLAIDMTVGEAGGKTALLLGACLGANGLNDKTIVGAILGYFDGGYTLTDAATALVDAGIVAQLAGGADNQHFVDWMALNLVDAVPDAATEDVLISFITSGQFTQATFLAALAAHQVNQDHIGLVGLQQNGVEFI